MKTILPSIFLLISLTACGLLDAHDEPGIPGNIVFSAKADENGTTQIFTMNADGTGLRQLTFWDRSSVDPAWSPDGRRIAFATGYQATTLGASLYIMDADGSNKRPLKKFPYESPRALYGSDPAWSPDGEKIAFDFCTNCEGGGSNYQIAVVEVEGEEYDSTQIQTITSYSGSDTNPKWSPDGSSIAFTSDRDYVSADTLRFRRDLYIRNSDGTNLERVTNFGFPGSYAWMNSNKLILTKTDINTKLKDIFIKNIITSKTTFLMKDLKVKPQLWIFWNPGKNQLFTINKSHNEIPIIIAVYNTNGKLISQHEITSSILKTALGFDWHISEEKN